MADGRYGQKTNVPGVTLLRDTEHIRPGHNPNSKRFPPSFVGQGKSRISVSFHNSSIFYGQITFDSDNRLRMA